MIYNIMKYLKSLYEYNKIEEQLFGSAVNKFSTAIFGDKKDSKGSSNDDKGDSENKGNQKMKVVKTETPPSEAKDLGSYGKFSSGKTSSDPLVAVYGGIDVGGRKSGIYMYDYFGPIAGNYNLFVATDHNVNGSSSYKALKDKAGNSPSKKILYLFSGGYRPGMDVLTKYGASEFDKIYLVDPWMGNKKTEDFYIKLAKENPSKVEYYYTSFGANSNTAKNGVSAAVKVKNAQKENQHMKTNEDAVSSLINFA
jgi:hypothetical protein